jgi:hypothetical protein
MRRASRRIVVALFAVLLAVALTPSARAATCVVVTTDNRVLSFDSATPGTTSLPTAIIGLQPGEDIVGIDYRPANGQLYALTADDRIYRLNSQTGVATFSATLNNGSGVSVPLTGTAFGFDFNPVADRSRIVSNEDQNLRVNADTGSVVVDEPLAFASTDRDAGVNPTMGGSAYTNNFAGATATTLYGVDFGLDTLVVQNPPNSGTLNTVGSLGINIQNLVGFDIAPGTNQALAVLMQQSAVFSSLYSINLATGAATLTGQVGSVSLSSVWQFSEISPRRASVPPQTNARRGRRRAPRASARMGRKRAGPPATTTVPARRTTSAMAREAVPERRASAASAAPTSAAASRARSSA